MDEWEDTVYRDFWARLSWWLVTVARAVLGGHRPDPVAVWATAPAWAESMTAFADGVVRDVAVAAWETVTGTRYDSRPAVTAHLATVHNRMVRTPDEVYDLVAREIAEAAARGEGIPETRDRVQGVLDARGHEDWPGRARTVARTETMGAWNAARDDGFTVVAGDVGGAWDHMWVSTVDARTRLTHREVDRQRRPLGQAFTVGGFGLRFPGDPLGPPQETINCRCTTILLRPGETVDLSNRQSRRD